MKSSVLVEGGVFSFKYFSDSVSCNIFAYTCEFNLAVERILDLESLSQSRE